MYDSYSGGYVTAICNVGGYWTHATTMRMAIHPSSWLGCGQYSSNDSIKFNHKNWWVDQISKVSGLAKSTVEDIITDLTYSNIKDVDLAVPLSETELALSACFVGVFVRPRKET